MTASSGLMVSVSGVRGRVGESLTPEIVVRFAEAFGSFLRSASERPAVVLARDSRTSGPMFASAASAGLRSVGCDVIDVGLAPTPTALLAVSRLHGSGAIVVTASHNPVEWNALKFASAAGMFLDADESARMRSYLEDGAISWAAWDGLGRQVSDHDAINAHLDAVLRIPALDPAGLRRRRFRVALDCVHGAGSLLLPRLLEELGCEVVGIGLEPDGLFPRPPEPVAENLSELERSVVEHACDLGMATDPDADRLSLVDGRGHAIGEDYTLALAARLALKHDTGPVVTNLSTSRVLEDVAGEFGVVLHRAPVGEINVARRMQAVGALIGGEGNGGVILPALHLTRDAAVGAAMVLQLLLEEDQTLAELVARHPGYVIVKDKVSWRSDAPESAYNALSERLAAPVEDRQDGLRLDWPKQRKWLHVRPSGTEPILRIIAEAESESAAKELVASAHDALA